MNMHQTQFYTRALTSIDELGGFFYRIFTEILTDNQPGRACIETFNSLYIYPHA